MQQRRARCSFDKCVRVFHTEIFLSSEENMENLQRLTEINKMLLFWKTKKKNDSEKNAWWAWVMHRKLSLGERIFYVHLGACNSR